MSSIAFRSWLTRLSISVANFLTQGSPKRRLRTRRFRPQLLPLEDRTLPTTITWVAPGSGSWHTASNWNLNRPPQAGDDVVIPDLAGTQTITFSSGPTTIDTLVASENVTLSGGTLNVMGSIQAPGVQLTLQGATLAQGTIAAGTTLHSASGLLDEITVNGHLSVLNNSSIAVKNGLTLNGTMDVGEADGISYGRLFFQGSQTLGGTGAVTLGIHTSNAIYAQDNGSPATLTIDDNIDVQGGSGTVGGYYNNDSLILKGSVTIPGGQALWLGGKDWVNNGTVTANGADVELYGSFVTTALGDFSATGGTVDLTATVTNTSSMFTFAPTIGTWRLRGGKFVGGTLASSGGSHLVLTGSGGALEGVTIAAGLTVDATQNISGQAHTAVWGGLTLEGEVHLGASDGSTSGRLYFQGTQTLTGTGEVTFGNHTSNAIYAQDNGSPATLTIDEDMAVQGGSGTVGGYYNNDSLILEGTINIAADRSLWLGGKDWVNNGTVTANGAEVELYGSFATSALGDFSATGGTVDLTGTLTNTGSTFTFSSAIGTWRLRGGKVVGGTLASSGGAKLVLTGSGGALQGVTIAAGLTVDATQNISGQAHTAVWGGLTLEGEIHLGASDGSTSGRLYFQGTQSLTGSGTVTFGNHSSNAIYAQDNGSPATLTIPNSISIAGGSGEVTGYYPNDTIILNAALTANTSGGILEAGDGGSGNTLTNFPFIKALNGGSVVLFQSLRVDGFSEVTTSANGSLTVAGNLLGTTRNAALFNPRGTITLNGGGTSGAPNFLEVMSTDQGSSASGFTDDFAYGVLALSNNTFAKLVDQSNNSPGSDAEAIYVNSLVVPAGCTLDLNGPHLFARLAQIGGTVTGGTVTQIPDSGSLVIDSPTPGSISVAGQLDNWTFFGRAGDMVTVVLDPGSGTPGGPINPRLNWGQVQILGTANQILATASSTTAGAGLVLGNVALPADGTYTIAVKAAASQSASIGNYVVTAWNVTAHTRALNVNQTTTGTLATPFSTERWTFSATANTQVRFDLLAASASGLAFSLTGPNGFVGFTNLTGSSPLVNLPATGIYSLTAQGMGGTVGNFTFLMAQTTLTSLAPGATHNGTFGTSGQAQLFQITVPSTQVLSLQLGDPAATHRTEMYAQFGSPPTRAVYDYRATQPSSQQGLLIPSASPGSWYVLVYAESVPQAGPYTLSATGSASKLTSITPNSSGNSSPVTLTLSGAGFLHDTTVVLVAANGTTTFVPDSFSIDTYTQITATFPAGLPSGTYSVRVTTGVNSSTLPAAFTLTPGGAANLVTDLVVPSALGRHALATIYVNYANTGTVAMPAPLLVLSNPNNDQPLLTLDENRITEGFWTSALPDGFSTTLLILASGSIPGVLQPGESVTVPVYYAGLQAPWDFSHTTVPLNLGVVMASDTTPVNWDSDKEDLRPDWISSEAWNPIYANIVTKAGNTAGGYVRLLDTTADYLGRLGERVTDVAKLWQFLVVQANGLSPTATLASVVDASMETPGMALSFGRAFGDTINSRYQLGALGWGWAVPWQASLSTLSDGTVLVTTSGGNQYRYQPDSRYVGEYFAATGDMNMLSAASGGKFIWEDVNGYRTGFRADGKLDFIEDTNGNKVTAGFDGAAKLTSLTHSMGQSLTIAYNAAGRIATITDSVGRVATYTYDAANQHLLSVQTPTGRTHYTYSIGNGAATEHALTSIQYSDGSHRYFTYDALGRLTSTSRDNNAERVNHTYDAPGEVTSTDLLGHATRLFYNHFGLVVKSQDALGHSTIVSYDPASLMVGKITDPTGQSRTFTYDTMGNLASSTDELGHKTLFTHGEFNRLTSLTDANGNKTTFAYDPSGNLLSTTYADSSATTTTFDPLGKPLSFTNRRGQAISYQSNAAGQVTRRTFPDGSHTDFTYDAHGHLKTAVDATGTITFTYDPATDRMTRVDYPGGRFLQFTYDPVTGHRTQMVDQTGFTVNYHYDAVGRLAWLKDGSGNFIVQYTYDVVGRLSRKDNGNGTFTTYQYDGNGNILLLLNHAFGGGISSRFDYTYDALGQRMTMTTADGTWTYTYEGTGQLAHAVFDSTNPAVPNQDLKYTYDAVGNRTGAVVNGAPTAYEANKLNEYISVGGVARTYDADGNLLSDGVSTYTYDIAGRLVSVTTAGTTTTYSYDALGNRSSSATGGQVTQYLTDPIGLPSVVGEFDGAGGAIAHNVHGLGLSSRVTGVASYYYDFDAGGNTVGLTNNGGVVNQYRYLPFGGLLTSNTSVPNPFLFAGQAGIRGEAGGLQYMRARSYSTTDGRFTTPDPTGLGGEDVNFYRYVGNSPLNAVDPRGTLECPLTKPDMNNLPPGWQDYLDAPGHTQAGLDWFHCGYDVILEYRDPSYWNSIFFYSEGPQNECAYDEAGNLVRGPGFFAGCGGTPNWCQGICYVVLDPGGVLLAGPTGVISSAIHSVVSAIVNAFDPNDKLTLSGYGIPNFVPAGTLMPYRINFENDSSATAPAQAVVITDPLSPNFDLATFRLTEIAFGDIIVNVPVDVQHFQTTVSMTYNNQTFDVLIEAGLHTDTGEVFATFQSLDPVTQLPPDVLTGFLPPEDGTGRGMGHISYVIVPKSNLPTGTEIRNVALITFDINAPISTDQVDPHDPSQGIDPKKQAPITIDATAPTSSVSALPGVSLPPTFLVQWSGNDANGSGIASYDLFVSVDNGPFTPWLVGTSTTSAQYTGATTGHTYAFYSVAVDRVGHREGVPAVPDSITLASNNSPSLAPIAERSLAPGAALVVAAVGSDPDRPNQTLTYRLINAPGGASIDAQSGVISWTAASPGSYQFTVEVSDNGTPVLSATQSFAVRVINPVPPPITATLFTKKAGKKKRLTIRVTRPDGLVREIVSPFQKPKYSAIRLMTLDSNGDGSADSVVITAKKGKKKVTKTLSV